MSDDLELLSLWKDNTFWDDTKLQIIYNLMMNDHQSLLKNVHKRKSDCSETLAAS